MDTNQKKPRIYKNIYGVVINSTKLPPERISEIDTKNGIAYEVLVEVMDFSGVKGSPARVPSRFKMDKAYEAGTRLFFRVSVSGEWTNFSGVIDEIAPAQKK